ncbi:MULTISPECIES: cobalamin biosynthesis protein [unclassified Pseudomonas]|uniref:cobalamin biosynthesis protein n=1 Tax=unclassified Pseudomonas TaxID=196821 RepID=UPI0025F060E2|nr:MULTISPECIES: cobalamin biosynthesis protein [unclassified Pseudomonas]
MNEAAPPCLVIGLGCQRGCPVSVLEGLIEVSLLEHRLTLADICALASIDLKSSESGLLDLAERLALPLAFFSAEELAAFEVQLSHRSQIAFESTGCHGVAESAALAMASRLSGSPARLVIERRNSSRATFALAAAAPSERALHSQDMKTP